MSIFVQQKIKHFLKYKRKIVHMKVCDSTNEVAKRRSDLPDGTLFIADNQTAGKGRLGRRWESEKRSGIYMSLLLKPDIAPNNAAQLTLIAGLAVAKALGGEAMIKWPNDVVIGSKKVCGILTELSHGSLICGIGINVNTSQFDDELKDKATSLAIVTGKRHSPEKLTAAVLDEFEPLYRKFLKDGFSALSEEYKKLCITLDKSVSVLKNGSEIRGTAVDISADGGLILQTENGRITVTSGEVSVRGIYGYV